MEESNGQLLEQNFQCEETQKPEEKLVFGSEPTTDSSTGLKGCVGKPVSMIKASEPDSKQDCEQLPLHDNKQEGMHAGSEHKITVDRNDVEQRGGVTPRGPQSCGHVSYFSTESNQPKLKLTADITQFSAKDLQEKDLPVGIGHDSDLVALYSSRKHLTMKARTPPCSPQEPHEGDNENMESLPCGRIQRKVRMLLGQKKASVEPGAELDKNRTEYLPAHGDRTCGSPVQSLLDLFQTSGEKSEFLGFTSYTENSGICDVLDIWGEDNLCNLLSTFFSSPSTSAFVSFLYLMCFSEVTAIFLEFL